MFLPTSFMNRNACFLNFIGCAIGGSREPAVDTAIGALLPYSGQPSARLLARRERFDPLHAALINGITGHVFEYDDTTPMNYIHPTPPVASALLSYASANQVGGRDFLHAFVMGFEVESRVGNAVYPAHYNAGWHITATAGVFGAAAATGKLLGLANQQMVWALGLAATQAAGLREMFGSMAKSFHAGRAAQNGTLRRCWPSRASLPGSKRSRDRAASPPCRLRNTTCPKSRPGWAKIFRFATTRISLIPAASSFIPTIDGCIDLHHRYRPAAESIQAVRVRVAPLVLDLCNKRDIRQGLDSKYSIYHSAAVGLVRGKAGLQEFSDDAANDPAIRRVREKVTAVADASVTEDQSGIEVSLVDGQTISQFVEQSLGNIHRPLSDRQLEEKFRDQAVAYLSSGQVDEVIKLCWRLEQLNDVGELVAATIPR